MPIQKSGSSGENRGGKDHGQRVFRDGVEGCMKEPNKEGRRNEEDREGEERAR